MAKIMIIIIFAIVFLNKIKVFFAIIICFVSIYARLLVAKYLIEALRRPILDGKSC